MTDDEFKHFMVRQGLSIDPDNYDGQGKTAEQDAIDSTRVVGYLMIGIVLVLACGLAALLIL